MEKILERQSQINVLRPSKDSMSSSKGSLRSGSKGSKMFSGVEAC